MAGNFNTNGVKGKVQYGAAWWYLDQKDGIEKQLNTLSNMGILSCFVGMLTDSRSILSYPALPMAVLEEHIEWYFDPERTRTSED